jgi:hypothetical protein
MTRVENQEVSVLILEYELIPWISLQSPLIHYFFDLYSVDSAISYLESPPLSYIVFWGWLEIHIEECEIIPLEAMPNTILVLSKPRKSSRLSKLNDWLPFVVEYIWFSNSNSIKLIVFFGHVIELFVP